MKKITFLTFSVLAFGILASTGDSSHTYANTTSATSTNHQVNKVSSNNLIINGDFTSGLNNWSPQTVGAGAVSVENDGNENFAKLVKGIVEEGELSASALSQDVVPVLGQKYQISFDYRGTGTFAAFEIKGLSSINILVEKLSTNMNQWKSYKNSVTFEQTADWDKTIDFTTGENLDSEQELNIKNVKLIPIN